MDGFRCVSPVGASHAEPNDGAIIKRRSNFEGHIDPRVLKRRSVTAGFGLKDGIRRSQTAATGCRSRRGRQREVTGVQIARAYRAGRLHLGEGIGSPRFVTEWRISAYWGREKWVSEDVGCRSLTLCRNSLRKQVRMVGWLSKKWHVVRWCK